MGDQILLISGTSLVGLDNRDALNIVRRVLSPEALAGNCAISVTVGRVDDEDGDDVKNEVPAIRTKSSSRDSSRHNDSYIMATQNGKEKVSIDPKMNRSQSLKALAYLNQQGGDDSVIYKDYPLENENDGDNAGFDRESTSRQSFSEKR